MNGSRVAFVSASAGLPTRRCSTPSCGSLGCRVEGITSSNACAIRASFMRTVVASLNATGAASMSGEGRMPAGMAQGPQRCPEASTEQPGDTADRLAGWQGGRMTVRGERMCRSGHAHSGMMPPKPGVPVLPPVGPPRSGDRAIGPLQRTTPGIGGRPHCNVELRHRPGTAG